MEQALIICAVLLSGPDLSNDPSTVHEQVLSCLPAGGLEFELKLPGHLEPYIQPDLLKPDDPFPESVPQQDSKPHRPMYFGPRLSRRALVRM